MSGTASKSAPQGPLKGLRVLDIATIVAAPSAAAMLGDYGAEVVKLELPIGDGARGFPPHKDGKALWWKVTNRNKKFATLDLRKPEGIAILKQLLPKFDVLIENFRPGTLDKWGLPKEVLWAIQPRLVILRATGFGQTGPYRNRPGFARIFEAMSGLTYITGEPDGEPMHAGYPIGDAVGGVFGALGIMTALWKRAKDPDAPGRGDRPLDDRGDAEAARFPGDRTRPARRGARAQRQRQPVFGARRGVPHEGQPLGHAGRIDQRAVCKQLPRDRPARN